VRGATATDPREEEPPAELLALRRELGLEYGRIDYVIVDGRVVIYDVNKTPSYKTRTPRLLAIARELAPGLLDVA
jgi:D-alanine-D-alanine ligase-like ATP-grasp enzyme